jgi:small multidrug resistance pump
VNAFVYLLLAIVSEVIGTNALKASDGYTKLWPSLLMVVTYALAFFLLSLTLKEIPIGTAYAIWSGLGTAGTVAIGVLVWREQLTLWHVVGVGLIIAGVLVLNLFTEAHA